MPYSTQEMAETEIWRRVVNMHHWLDEGVMMCVVKVVDVAGERGMRIMRMMMKTRELFL